MPFSLKDRHIIVKYHYIENPCEDRGAFYPCSVSEFARQVSFLKNNFRITTVEEVLGAAQNKSPERVCALTFDDGLKDQYENAVPILDQHGIKGAFFPITKTFEGFLPATHKMHVILSLKDASKLIDMFNAFLADSFPHVADKFAVDKTKRLTTQRKMYDDIPTANLKEIMNRIPHRIRDAFLDSVFGVLRHDEKGVSRELFMSPEDVQRLNKKGHIVGIHGHSHEALDTIEESLAREEITVSKNILEEITKTQVAVLAYPQSAPQKKLDTMLKKRGIVFALGTERRDVREDGNPYCLPRYDTNDIRDFLNTQHF